MIYICCDNEIVFVGNQLQKRFIDRHGRVLIDRLPAPIQVLADSRTEVAVLQLPGTSPVGFTQTFVPERTVLAVCFLGNILPIQAAGGSRQNIPLQRIPLWTNIQVIFLIITEVIVLKFGLAVVSVLLVPDEKCDPQVIQDPVGQWEILGGIGSRRLKGNYLAVDSLDLF